MMASVQKNVNACGVGNHVRVLSAALVLLSVVGCAQTKAPAGKAGEEAFSLWNADAPALNVLTESCGICPGQANFRL